MTIMQEIKPLLGSDAAEIRCIGKIANAHGGKVEGNPDKIGLLQEDPVNGEDVQMRFIAAILRFADELADDKNRASRFLLDHELIPEESQVYHKYSSCLESVMVRPDEQCIDLHFVLSSNDATNFWGKKLHNGEIDQVYLIDEIYARTYKMHLERTYCSRFLRPHVDLTRINVKIEIIDDPHTYAAPEESIEYRLEETGYPGGVDADIHSLCEGLQTGKELAERIKIVRDI